MRNARRWSLLALLLLACGYDPDAGRRFRAERDFWNADWEFRKLAVRPKDAGKNEWEALARRFEQIADRTSAETRVGTVSRFQAEHRAVGARALFSAAEVRGGVGDSIELDHLYRRLAREFGDVSGVKAEVALSQGRIAESRRRLDEAADLYQEVVDEVAPDPTEQGITSEVIDLPLFIARLRAQGGPPGERDRSYQPARERYQSWIRENPFTPLQIDAQARLAEIAADLGDWREATRALRVLEAQLRAMNPPSRDPAGVRLALAGIQSRTGEDPESIRVTLLSLVRDYPGSSVLPQALHALALNAERRGETEEALGYLEQLDQTSHEDSPVASLALLTRARILEGAGRWKESLETYRSIPVEYPLTEAALQTLLEIAEHYEHVGDEEALSIALKQAEREYSRIVSKYPPGRPSLQARQALARTLTWAKNYDAAVGEMVALGEDLAPERASAALLLAAADLARRELSDSLRAAGILDRLSQVYPGSEIGLWAAKEAVRLRGGGIP